MKNSQIHYLLLPSNTCKITFRCTLAMTNFLLDNQYFMKKNLKKYMLSLYQIGYELSMNCHLTYLTQICKFTSFLDIDL